jgi:hypothetical protein
VAFRVRQCSRAFGWMYRYGDVPPMNAAAQQLEPGTPDICQNRRRSAACYRRDGPVQFVATGPQTQMLCREHQHARRTRQCPMSDFDGAVLAVSW